MSSIPDVSKVNYNGVLYNVKDAVTRGKMDEVDAARQQAIQDIQAEGQTQTGAVTAEGTAQKNAVTAEGIRVLGTIPNDYTALAGDVSDIKSAIDDITGSETVVGKNLFNPVYLLDATGWQTSEGEYYGQLNNLSNEFSGTGYPFTNPFKESTRYTLSFKHKCSTDSAVLAVKFYYTDGTNNTITVARSENWASGSATSTANKTIDYAYISYGSKGTAIWYLKEIQFEEGSTATEYEEYGTGGTTYTINPDAIPDESIGKEKLSFSFAEGQFVSWIAGKKISIIGDSIDTFDQDGYKISGYRMYYPALGVTDVNNTWWKRVIDASGAELEINASWSGSCVTDIASESGYPDFYDRISLIGTPDVVFVTLGTNDSRNSAPLGEYDFDTAYTILSESTFRTAYIKGIKGLKALYPDAQIVCIAQQMSDDYRDSIVYIAQNLQCVFIDASDYVGEDTVHPGVYGMRQISSLVLHATDTELTQEHLPADGKQTGIRLKNVETQVQAFGSMVDVAWETGKNLFDSSHLLLADWTKSGDVFSGTLSALVAKYGKNVADYPFRNSFKENTRYTFSCKAYTENEKSGTGSGLVVYFRYTDGSDGQAGISNTTDEFTQLTLVSSANKTLAGVRFSYGSKPANVWYVKEIQLEEGTEATTFEAYTETALSVIKETAIKDYSIGKEKLSFDLGKGFRTNAFPRMLFTINKAESDMAYVGEMLWAFGSSSDDHSSYAGINRMEINYEEGTYTSSRILHNWGHINSIDYSRGADALITSNAGQSTTDEGIIYIIQNVSALKEMTAETQVPFADYVLQIDCSGLNLGYKFQLCWGESNAGRFDIAYLITSDMQTIRRIQLGKGSNELTYGTIVSGAGADEFNGTFDILDTFTTGIQVQNNGIAYKGGHIYAVGAHVGYQLLRFTLEDSGIVDVDVYNENCVDGTGSPVAAFGEGVALNGNYMAFGLNGTSIGIFEM